MKRIVTSLLFVVFAAAAIAGSSWVVSEIYRSPKAGYQHVTATLLADGTGTAVTDAITVRGRVMRAVTTPRLMGPYIVTSGGSEYFWPTTGWNCVLNDTDGVDVLGGQLTNSLTTTVKSYQFTRLIGTSTFLDGSMPVNGPVYLNCTNMGTTHGSRSAYVKLYVEE